MQSRDVTDLFIALQLDFETAPILDPCVNGIYLVYVLFV